MGAQSLLQNGTPMGKHRGMMKPDASEQFIRPFSQAQLLHHLVLEEVDRDWIPPQSHSHHLLADSALVVLCL